MSIVTTFPAIQRPATALYRLRAVVLSALPSLLLTPLSLLILGFHPYAEDGGLYLAGVKYLLDPSLFPQQREFVTAPLRYSAFAPCMAWFATHSGIRFELAVFTIFLLCLWATIFAAWFLAVQCFSSMEERWGATLLMALWLSLPVAGTSLMLVDPYLTARSLSTPLVLFAIANALAAVKRSGEGLSQPKRSLAFAGMFLVLAAIFHPLMAGYGAAFIIATLALERWKYRSRLARATILMVAGLSTAAVVHYLSPSASATVSRVALTRSYWFLSQWQWFELLGLAAPLFLLACFSRTGASANQQGLSRSALTVGVSSIFVSLCFARTGLASMAVAHLQPLRVFQLIYFALLLSLGAWLGRTVLQRTAWRWGVAALLLGLPVAVPAWMVFPNSSHLEVAPGNLSRNSWVRAFEWIRCNTSKSDLFALDANYISDPTEDAQSFRAIAERSALPDYSKDGGETAVNSQLGDAWVKGVGAQQSISMRSDSQRLQSLQPFGVAWLVLRSHVPTDFRCPYDNGTVKVCSLH